MVRVKARAVDNKRWQRLDPAGGRWGIFGLHTVPDDATEVVVTEVRVSASNAAYCVCLPALGRLSLLGAFLV